MSAVRVDSMRARSAPATMARAPGVSSACGGQGVLVTFNADAFSEKALIDTALSLRQLKVLTQRVIAPIRERITKVEYSPVIRTARLAVRDSASVRGVVAALGRVAEASEVALDACALRVQGKPQ
jgi:hypothetical protein